MPELRAGYQRCPAGSPSGGHPLHRLQVPASLLNHGSWFHLTRRFLRSFRSAELTLEEREQVERWLRPHEVVFFNQPHSDQRHGFKASQSLTSRGVTEPVWVRAALLHDVGKRASGLGTWGRSLVTGLSKVGLARLISRPHGRADLYLRHGELGAEELAGLGAETEVVEFALHHHGSRPARIPADIWQVLQEADR